MFLLLCLFLVSKVFHLVHVISIMGDFDEHRDANAEIANHYPQSLSADDVDVSVDKFKSDCILVTVQYVVILLIIAAAMILTKKTNHYINLLAWIIALVQLLELPIAPVFPCIYLLITATWVFASYFFLTVLSF